MRISTLVSVLLSSLCGCTTKTVSGPVDLLKVDADANPCGEWQLNLRAQGHAGALVLEVDGHRHREWAIDGEMNLQTTGQAGPGQSLNMELIASNLRHPVQIQMPQLIVDLQGDLAESALPADTLPLKLELDSPCTLRVAISWEVLLDGLPLEQGRFIAGSNKARLILPAMEPGSHQIEALASWSDVSVATWSQTIEVGAQPGP